MQRYGDLRAHDGYGLKETYSTYVIRELATLVVPTPSQY
jgi:hypothetical protein